jgi:DNA-binding PadR family transcriptional regulator
MFGPPHGFPPLKEFESIRELIFMWSISESVDGITGYELKSLFSIPQTSVYRVLNVLEEKEFVKADEKIVEGRVQKRYMLTESGHAKLDELKRSIGAKLSILFEITNDARGNGGTSSFIDARVAIFKNRMRNVESKEDALFYLDNFAEMSNRQHKMLEIVVETSGKISTIIGKLRALVEAMDVYSPEPLFEFIDKEIENLEKPED